LSLTRANRFASQFDIGFDSVMTIHRAIPVVVT
jgi:hypothetical protein